jgi:hypothetical protein
MNKNRGWKLCMFNKNDNIFSGLDIYITLLLFCHHQSMTFNNLTSMISSVDDDDTTYTMIQYQTLDTTSQTWRNVSHLLRFVIKLCMITYQVQPSFYLPKVWIRYTSTADDDKNKPTWKMTCLIWLKTFHRLGFVIGVDDDRLSSESISRPICFIE